MTAQSIETTATCAALAAPPRVVAVIRDGAASDAGTELKHGSEIVVPLNRMNASPRNARKAPHAAATIEAFAASIKGKEVLQPPVAAAPAVLVARLAVKRPKPTRAWPPCRSGS